MFKASSIAAKSIDCSRACFLEYELIISGHRVHTRPLLSNLVNIRGSYLPHDNHLDSRISGVITLIKEFVSLEAITIKSTCYDLTISLLQILQNKACWQSSVFRALVAGDCFPCGLKFFRLLVELIRGSSTSNDDMLSPELFPASQSNDSILMIYFFNSRVVVKLSS